ncbi:MAG: SDR family NAD(P)-dependent oxidoreductase [Dehalococcoidia bacterium]|nr:SDR family NAD(P)-dependent oxidoreductase [Dehalococcoidia bacterium]
MQDPDLLRGTWAPPGLHEAIACVTGASYGAGRGIAEVLGKCGATVYVTGRSKRRRASGQHSWSVEETAELVTAAGGTGVAVALDHTSEDSVSELFRRIAMEHSRLDLLVNNVWQWGPKQTDLSPTWEQPLARWDAMFGVGVRSHFVTTRHALPPMIEAGRGLIVFTHERPGDAKHFAQNIVVDSAVAATRRMAEYLAHELAPHGIAALLVYLGWIRSVNMGMGFRLDDSGMSQDDFFRLTQSTYFIGRAIASLAADPQVIRHAGRTLYAGEVAVEYGFTDVDGRRPRYEGGE